MQKGLKINDSKYLARIIDFTVIDKENILISRIIFFNNKTRKYNF